MVPLSTFLDDSDAMTTALSTVILAATALENGGGGQGTICTEPATGNDENKRMRRLTLVLTAATTADGRTLSLESHRVYDNDSQRRKGNCSITSSPSTREKEQQDSSLHRGDCQTWPGLAVKRQSRFSIRCLSCSRHCLPFAATVVNDDNDAAATASAVVAAAAAGFEITLLLFHHLANRKWTCCFPGASFFSFLLKRLFPFLLSPTRLLPLLFLSLSHPLALLTGQAGRWLPFVNLPVCSLV